MPSVSGARRESVLSARFGFDRRQRRFGLAACSIASTSARSAASPASHREPTTSPQTTPGRKPEREAIEIVALDGRTPRPTLLAGARGVGKTVLLAEA